LFSLLHGDGDMDRGGMSMIGWRLAALSAAVAPTVLTIVTGPHSGSYDVGFVSLRPVDPAEVNAYYAWQSLVGLAVPALVVTVAWQCWRYWLPSPWSGRPLAATCHTCCRPSRPSSPGYTCRASLCPPPRCGCAAAHPPRPQARSRPADISPDLAGVAWVHICEIGGMDAAIRGVER
jgi:hypothetical protein